MSEAKADGRRRISRSVALTDEEEAMAEMMAELLGLSVSEVVRRSLMSYWPSVAARVSNWQQRQQQLGRTP